MSHETCRNCKYYNANNADRGTCTRYPPRAFLAGQNKTISLWPVVRTDQSCGEWKQRLYVAKELPQAAVVQ